MRPSSQIFSPWMRAPNGPLTRSGERCTARSHSLRDSRRPAVVTPFAFGSLRASLALAAQDALHEGSRLLAPHVDEPQLAQRFEAVRIELDGSREHLARHLLALLREMQTAQEEVGLRAIGRQLAALVDVRER